MNSPAYPTFHDPLCSGVSKFEWIAALALQGLLARKDIDAPKAASMACDYAKALLAELESRSK